MRRPGLPQATEGVPETGGRSRTPLYIIAHLDRLGPLVGGNSPRSLWYTDNQYNVNQY